MLRDARPYPRDILVEMLFWYLEWKRPDMAVVALFILFVPRLESYDLIRFSDEFVTIVDSIHRRGKVTNRHSMRFVLLIAP